MRVKTVLGCISVLLVFLALPLLGVCEGSSQTIAEGQRLHLGILSRHRYIDKFYKAPFVQGSGTSNPICYIALPSRDWDSLSGSKKQALADYAASLVNKVKAHPFKYSGVSSSAPAASFISRNIAKMTDTSWCIEVGPISDDGRDINAERNVRCGK
jgi:hypothetical protein